MSEPTTKTGRALSEWNRGRGGGYVSDEEIAAIEREAAALERERQIAVRKDWGSLPHGEFYEKYGNLAKDLYLLPTNCGCPDCRLWASGS